MIKTNFKISSFTLIVGFLCLALGGLAFLPMLPVKLSPSAMTPNVNVSFNMYGSSARVVEMEATSKLEGLFARVKGIKEISSQSGNGWGRISIGFDKHVDLDIVRFEVSSIIRQAWPSLPETVTYPLVSVNRSDDNANRPFMSYSLNAPATPILIMRYAENVIKPQLAQVPGVYRVDVSGATPMEWQILYDNAQLIQLGIKVDDIRNAISTYLRKDHLGMGLVSNYSGDNMDQWKRLAVVPEEEISRFDPAKLMVKDKNGQDFSLDKLLKVERVEEQPRSYFRINGLNSIYLSVVAEETANQIEVAKAVKAVIDQATIGLPTGYQMHLRYDSTEYINNELRKIYIRTGTTILILLLFVLLITRNLKYLFLIVVSLSVNIAIALIFYYLLGLEIQLYSLAGITISLSLVIDNTIIMSDHLMHKKNLKAFLSILAATLTTMGALVIIFFLDEKIRLNLQDFAAVVIVNLFVSLFIALFFVPSMIEKLRMDEKKPRKGKPRFQFTGKFRFLSPRRFVIYITRGYAFVIRVLCRRKWIPITILIFAFGLPVFMLPDKIKEPGKYGEKYNELVAKPFYKEKVKPYMDKFLGGTLRLFIEKVSNSSYYNREGEISLSINATLPSGSTLMQMNNLVQRMEAYLSEFKDIKQFQTNIYSPNRAYIQVNFTKEIQNSSFPYMLRSNIVSKALQLGGGSWSVYGLPDNQGFNNDVRESVGNYTIDMTGYNYDELYAHAERLKAQLLTNRRIKEVTINYESSYWKDDYKEFSFDLNKEMLAKTNLLANDLFASISPVFGKDMTVGSVIVDKDVEYLKLSSRQSSLYDIWSLMNFPYRIGQNEYKLTDFATIQKGQAPQNVAKKNQQYVLVLQYEYLGVGQQGEKILERTLKEFNTTLPMGYNAKGGSRSYWWSKENQKSWLLLVLIIVIIFFTTSILFNSLKQPLSVICVIPVSYIGVFLTFYLFKLNFDQGGFASFILLCGITVNASIYIINEYNNVKRAKPAMPSIQAYLKAWNSKIIPIFLTIVSTILGFIPFMLGQKEGFWFPLAAGTIGGLVMSMVAIFIYLPVFTLKRQRKNVE